MQQLPFIIGIYKPKGPTSHDVIAKLRRILGEKKIGHAGTLDPLAEGILVVGITRAGTKNLQNQVQKEKEYLAEIFLGAQSSTDDEEGQKKYNETTKIPDLQTIEENLKKFQGEIMQTPPIYSALKIGGRTAYKLAHKGQSIQMKPRVALIKEMVLLSYQWPILKLKITTGPGVYVRALARDIGIELGTSGYLANLKRTRVGDFDLKNVYTLKKIEAEFKK